MHEVLVNRLGGLSLPRKSVVRLTDRPDMTLDVYRGRKATIQPIQPTNQNNANNLDPSYKTQTPSRSLGLFRKGKTLIIAKFCRTDFCLACEAEARHRYCFSGGVGGSVGGVSFCRVFWFSSVSQEL